MTSLQFTETGHKFGIYTFSDHSTDRDEKYLIISMIWMHYVQHSFTHESLIMKITMNFIVELLYKAQQKKPKWPFPWALQIQIRTFICQVIWNFRHDNLSQIVSDLEAVTSHLSLSRSV